jgi:preprotein translocase subunit SecE
MIKVVSVIIFIIFIALLYILIDKFVYKRWACPYW